MATSHPHEDPQTVEDAHADHDPAEDEHHGAHGHGHDDGHAVERSGWVLIPLGIGVAIAAAIIALVGVRSGVPERTEPLGTRIEAEDHDEPAGDHAEETESEADGGH